MNVGDRFNWLTLVEKVVGGRSSWLVECDCGARFVKREDWIKSGRTKSCKSCASKRTAAKYGMPSSSRFIGSLGRTYYSTLVNGAKRRYLNWDVTQEFLWILFLRQNKKCALTGMPITLSTKIKNSAPDYKSFTASLDRVNPNLGYTEDNVQWVHKDINRLKNNYNQDRFIDMCRLVSNYANQQPSLSRNTLEGSTTNLRPLTDCAEGCNEDTSA